MRNTPTTESARALSRHWISRFGFPLDMSSDRGSQFTSTTRAQVTQCNRLSPSIQWNYRQVSSIIEDNTKGPSARAQLG